MGEFLTEKQVIELKQAHKQIKEKRLADRIKAILYLNYGLSYSDIAKLLLFDEVTIRRYVKSFKERGLNGLLEFHYTGGQTKLTKAQELELKNHLIDSPYIYLTAKEVASFVKHHYKVSTINLLDAILDKHSLGRIYLIWDNARYYYYKYVQTYLKHNPRLIPKFLPSYSPNLNLIERLWRLFHQKILYNHYYQTFPDFKQATLGFFENLHHYKKEMRTLLTDNFQIVPT